MSYWYTGQRVRLVAHPPYWPQGGVEGTVREVRQLLGVALLVVDRDDGITDIGALRWWEPVEQGPTGHVLKEAHSGE